MNHKEIIELEELGKILIGVNRPMARKFYTDITTSEIKLKTGEAPYLEKLIVWLAFLTAPISLITSIIFSFIALNWWGLISLVVLPVIYFSYASASAVGNSKLIGISIILALSTTIYFGRFFANSKITLIITLFVFSLWCIRFLYCSSTFFLRAFIIRNEKAFEFLKDYVIIRNV